jgi:hypothetical protein
MYLVEDLSNPHDRRVRARATMSSLGVPDQIAGDVLAALEVPQNRAPTVVVFANTISVDVFRLPFELPVIDPRTGRADARWGEPYLIPLLLAHDLREHFVVASIGRERWRTFEVVLGTIMEIGGAVHPHEGVTHPTYVHSMGGAWKDRFEQHRFEHVRRFFEDLGNGLDRLLTERGIDRLIVLGPDRDLAVFEESVPRTLLDRVVAREAGLPDPEAPPNVVLERVLPVIVRVEAEETRQAIDEAENRGARGLEKCLTVLQRNRVHTLVVPWNLDEEVYETRDGYISPRNVPGAVRRVPLREVLPSLASAYGATLTYARGANEERLMELGGMCGLLRW